MCVHNYVYIIFPVFHELNIIYMLMNIVISTRAVHTYTTLVYTCISHQQVCTSTNIEMGCTPSKDGEAQKESAVRTNRFIRQERQKQSVVLKAVETGQYSEMKGFESDPRCPLSERQLYSICKSWKAINRDMVTTAVNMFIRYVDFIISNVPLLHYSKQLWQQGFVTNRLNLSAHHNQYPINGQWGWIMDKALIFSRSKMWICVRLLFVMCVVSVVVDAARRFWSPPEVARVVQRVEDGSTQRLVAQRLGVSRSVIGRLWRRYQETGGYSRRPGQGRLRCTTAREERFVVMCALRNRFVTARQLQYDLRHATNIQVRDQTETGSGRKVGEPENRPDVLSWQRVIAETAENTRIGRSLNGQLCCSQMSVWRCPGERL